MPPIIGFAIRKFCCNPYFSCTGEHSCLPLCPPATCAAISSIHTSLVVGLVSGDIALYDSLMALDRRPLIISRSGLPSTASQQSLSTSPVTCVCWSPDASLHSSRWSPQSGSFAVGYKNGDTSIWGLNGTRLYSSSGDFLTGGISKEGKEGMEGMAQASVSSLAFGHGGECLKHPFTYFTHYSALAKSSDLPHWLSLMIPLIG